MLNRRLVSLGLLALATASRAAEPAFRLLGRGSFAQLVAARRDQPFLLVLWSITCVPCREEFELLRELRDRYPRMPLVLVATDDQSDAAMAARMLDRYEMGEEESWMFADDPQRLRYEIDPAWYGELPRAYFYDARHRREAVSGSLERDRVEAWIEAVGAG